MSENKGWKSLDKGAVAYKSSRDYETGDWGVTQPKFNHEKCTKCTLCHFYCPEGAIRVREVITVDENSTVKEAVDIMNEFQIGSLIVLERGKAMGIVTERDFLSFLICGITVSLAAKYTETMSNYKDSYGFTR